MNKNKNLPYLIGGGLLLVGVGGYFLYKSLKDKRELEKSREKDAETPSTTKGGSVSPAQTLTKSFPISKGTFNNEYVAQMQTALGVTADGDWGNKTETALQNRGIKISSIPNISVFNNLISDINKGVGVQVPLSTKFFGEPTNLSKTFPISKGTNKNFYVQELQKALGGLTLDGSWGNNTENAMRSKGQIGKVFKNADELYTFIMSIAPTSTDENIDEQEERSISNMFFGRK
jgi:hypothetical protein